MAIGDMWDVSAQASNGSFPTPRTGPDDDHPNPPGKVRLALAKVLPTADAKHRGTGRRPSVEKRVRAGMAELDDVDAAMRRRNEILVAAIKRTQDLYIVTDQRQSFRLAAADLFVEKTQ